MSQNNRHSFCINPLFPSYRGMQVPPSQQYLDSFVSAKQNKTNKFWNHDLGSCFGQLRTAINHEGILSEIVILRTGMLYITFHHRIQLGIDRIRYILKYNVWKKNLIIVCAYLCMYTYVPIYYITFSSKERGDGAR